MEDDEANSIEIKGFWKSQISMEGESEGRWRAEEAIRGNARALEILREYVTYPFVYAEEAKKLGLKWPKGILLHGEPGTGKTSLVRAIVRESNAHLTSIRREQESRVVGQLLTLMDGNGTSSKPHVVVVAATNRVDTIDPALRRPGRFDSEIEVSVPTVEERLEILELHSKKFQMDSGVDLQAIAASCNGYVGADLEALCREAARSACRRSPGLVDSRNIPTLQMEDWEYARSQVPRSITRGITMELPKETWDDIGGLKELKKKLQQAVEWPIKHANAFARLGISPVRGVLLHGPPGCSKTTLAKAAAHAAQASFFSLSGAELYSKYVGEGESLLRRTFQKARLASPSIIFFDEADAIAPKRGDGGSGSNTKVGERLLSTLLTEMDGLELATGIVVLAATNRPQAIDPALMRPGRFDMMKLGEDVDLQSIAESTNLFTGADLKGLCREAGIIALREDRSASCILGRHFQTARDSLRPSLTISNIEEYSSFMKVHG
ncbi:hypothetical protein QJS04_geneDACA007992 [Acorus gramineus]|uniref:AAA+ ATPase domain-containing protein n=1 Tax=Acorus gramineus TaxID=55184 RepID=A0AAV9BB69_ACOGR|nr:hypothetical protein QJS04_geneDACA007992 [Acorus gramineus]